MIVSDELQELMLIIDQEGLSHLVGDMLAYALAPSLSRWGDDAGEGYAEPTDPLERAVEFLRFQIVVAENQIKEAEEVVSELQGGVATPIQFNPMSLDEDAQEEPLEPTFASKKRAEEWSTAEEREEVIKNLDSLLMQIKVD